MFSSKMVAVKLFSEYCITSVFDGHLIRSWPAKIYWCVETSNNLMIQVQKFPTWTIWIIWLHRQQCAVRHCHATNKHHFLLGFYICSKLARVTFLEFTVWLGTDGFPLWQDFHTNNAFPARKENQSWAGVVLWNTKEAMAAISELI